MSRPCLLVLALLLLSAAAAQTAAAASFVLPLAADSPRPVMIYGIQANDGVSTASWVVHVEAVSGFAVGESEGCQPMGRRP